MKLYKAAILTPWTGKGTDNDPHHPLVADKHNLQRWSDVTRQTTENLIPDFNLFLIHAVVDQETLDNINKDIDFFVIWSDDEE